MHGISLTGEFSTSGYSLRRPRALLVPCTEALHNMSASFRLPSKKRGKGDNTATGRCKKEGREGSSRVGNLASPFLQYCLARCCRYLNDKRVCD